MSEHSKPDYSEPVRNVTLMVCTYKRPELLPRFLHSVEGLKIPQGIKLHIALCDNNAESHYDRYIRAALERLPCAHSYGHEPEPGYSNARNKALALALDTPAELLAFSDDDMQLNSGWLAGHLRSHAEFGCDVVGGAIQGRMSGHAHGRRFKHGEICRTQGAGNVSFRRWLVDADGLGLRFDPRFNKTGREDQAFFSQAHRRGARIIFSAYPVIHDPAMSGEGWLDELLNKAAVSALMQRNDIVRLRKEKGILLAFAASLWSIRFGVKYLVAQTDRAISLLLGRNARAKLKRVSVHKNGHKMIEAFKGLRGGLCRAQRRPAQVI